MKPEALHLRRSRWTLVFTLPFVVFMLAGGIWALVIALTSDERIWIAVGCFFAFAALCIGGAIGKGMWEALSDRGVALIIDEEGVNDVRGGRAFAWSEIERIGIVAGGARILLNLKASAMPADTGLQHGIRRLVGGADHAIELRGLSYSPRALDFALKAFPRNAASRSTWR
ncbi:hypothetical protein [Uliginosibacterium sp. H1]|uniref:hypothetical protein n=1 Tax=Uliginosibacterium sp. H1 TaxID=3114757 RepID=UPI002E170249|nr:hypothetical protein [Uliginosibacterium sp. H1]